MQDDFKTANDIGKQLGRDGEISEWLAVKPRANGRVRSMTMLEAIEYHDEVWGFKTHPFNPGDHTAAHLIMGLVYGDNVSPYDYQGTIPVEMITVTLEKMIRDPIHYFGQITKNKMPYEYFHEEIDLLHGEQYGWAMFYRTLIFDMVQRERAQGKDVSSRDIRERNQYSFGRIEKDAKRMGINFHRNDYPSNAITSFEIYGLNKTYVLEKTNEGHEADLPPIGDDFQDLSPYPEELQKQIFARAWPAVALIIERAKALRNPTRFIEDEVLYGSIKMTEIFNVMKDIPAPMPMRSVSFAPKAESAQRMPEVA